MWNIYLQDEVAARRVRPQFNKSNQLACPTTGFIPFDIQRENRALPNRFSDLSGTPNTPSKRCQNRKAAEGTGIHLDGIQSLYSHNLYSVRPVCAMFAEEVR